MKTFNCPIISAELIFVVLLIKLQFVIKLSKCASIPCLPCDSKPKPSSAAYEEFVFEHQVTKQEAIDALNQLNDSFFQGSKEPGCKAFSCSQKVMKYCLGAQFINDHCWCEQGHGKEGLPWVPHTCYVGEKQYSASVGSCYFFNEVKECCCNHALAKQWRHLSGSSKAQNQNRIVLSILTMAGCLFYRRILLPT